MDPAMLNEISAKVVEQYEQVRQSGVTNMYNQMGVAAAADAEGFHELVVIALDRPLYAMLLSNLGALIAHYKISQEMRD